jgi:HEPN domain-containing protein
MNALTAEWLGKAEEDFSVAVGLARRRRIPANSVCFHCQQAAEKHLKALLQEHGVRFGKTHDLEGLLRLVGAVTPEMLLLADDVKLLSDYAVRYRYPGADATSRQARDAVLAARKVRGLVRGLLYPRGD